jgi:hypothetical protein
VEKLLCDEAEEERRPALRRVRDAAPAMGLEADGKPVRCWRRSDLVAERSPRLTADMVLFLNYMQSITNWSLRREQLMRGKGENLYLNIIIELPTSPA